MPELIQALKSVNFPQSRPQKREPETLPRTDFARWLHNEDAANSDAAAVPAFSAPFMSPESILILAEAQAEEFQQNVAHVYQHAAEIMPEDEDQLIFEFLDGHIEDEEV